MKYVFAVRDYDLGKTFTCGQVFRYKKLDDCAFQICSRDKVAVVSGNSFQVVVETSSDSFNDSTYWEHYLNLNQDDTKVESLLSSNSFLKEVYNYSKGLHLLKQDPWETLVSFIISQQKRIPQIQASIEKLCNLCGVPMGDDYHAFPTPYQVLSHDLRELSLGYRKDYVEGAAHAVSEGRINLEAIKYGNSTLQEAFDSLVNLYGVGTKVANCVLLYGLGHTDAFPIDVHIRRMLSLPEMRDFDILKLGMSAGLVQQYLFNYAINHGI